MIIRSLKKISIFLSLSLMLSTSMFGTAFASPNIEKTYTTDSDFSLGTSVNLSNKIPDQLQLDDTTKPFGFIWVAVSTKGTVVKMETETGKVLGEYKVTPDSEYADPSRTTVDKYGSVWVANRAGNSVTRICLPESGLWIDKNGNGKCDTSVGLNDIKPWVNLSGVDSDGGVETAEDECIINYVKVNSYATRHVSVDKNNDVWVSGLGNRVFDLIDGETGAIKRTEGPALDDWGRASFGGYGGLIDKNDVIWSSNQLLRWDTSNPLTGSNGSNWTGYSHDSYGLTIDNDGNVWNSSLYGNQIRKFAPDGTLLGTYGHGFENAQGCVADSNGDIWVAHSIFNGNSVGHIKNDGTYVGNVQVGSGPTGVAIDAKGKIWATNYNDGTVSRIDPTQGPLGADGVTPVGIVDFTSEYLGGNLYNYSDMTGSTLIGAPNLGTWSTVYDSGVADTEWGIIDWNSLIAGDGTLGVAVESSNDGVNFSPQEMVLDGNDMTIPNGRYLKINITFKRASTGESPILYDITVKSSGEDNQELHGCMTGGGSILADDGTRVTHGFIISSNITAESNNLEINWGKNNRFHLTNLTEVALTNDSNINAGNPSVTFNTFKGKATGIYNGKEGYNIEFIFTDAGEPGSKDFASIVIKDSQDSFILKASGKLDRGNQQARNE